MNNRRPFLFIGNNEKEDGEAMRLLQNYEIDFQVLFPPENEETPALLDGFIEYNGLKEINRYLSKIKNRE